LAQKAPETTKITAFATQGSGGAEMLDDELRLHTLLERFSPRYLPFDRKKKLESFLGVLRSLSRERPDMVVMEGSGVAGGAAVLAARALYGTRYVLSSGDAIAPFVRRAMPAAYPLFLLYEWMLCRYSSGFVGWSPYTTGRALTFGARSAMTAPGWAPFPQDAARAREARRKVRARLRIGDDALIFGIVGSLAWNVRVKYCYGLELVRALALATERPELHVVIVGDGDGRSQIEAMVTPEMEHKVHMTGRVPRTEVPDYLAAMDVVTLPQSVDAVGSFRYTTKLSEYLAAGLPVATNQIPLAYDLPGDWHFRLPGSAPWDPVFIDGLATLMRTVSPSEIQHRRDETVRALPLFERAEQVERFTEFVLERCDER
jgi:glycosyltransferase involved in cell wall biosynthesis